MAKPIAVIYYNKEVLESPGITHNKIRKSLSEQLYDYHVILVPYLNYSNQPQRDTIELKVFYEKDWALITFEELKKLIEDATTQPGSDDQNVLGEN